MSTSIFKLLTSIVKEREQLFLLLTFIARQDNCDISFLSKASYYNYFLPNGYTYNFLESFFYLCGFTDEDYLCRNITRQLALLFYTESLCNIYLYNLNGNGWLPYFSGETITLNQGDFVQFRMHRVAAECLQYDDVLSRIYYDFGYFYITGLCLCCGKLLSLFSLKYGSFLADFINPEYCVGIFYGLFAECDIEDASNLILPNLVFCTDMYMECFKRMRYVKIPT